MAGVPKTLVEWEFESIVELVSKGYTETDRFDFKEVLHASNNQENYRDGLTKAARAFANSQGGFLVFGVKDAQTGESTEARLVGIPNSTELAKHFADAITNAEPSIIFEHTNPAIPLRQSENVILVIHIPTSRRGPHITRDGLFYKRTNAGNELMSYAEIRNAFTNYEERFSKVKLLYMTLLDLWIRAERIKKSSNSDDSFTLVHLDANTIMPILSDVYSLLSSMGNLPGLLIRIKRDADLIDTAINLSHQSAVLPHNRQKIDTLKYNTQLIEHASDLQKLTDQALNELEVNFDFRRKRIEDENGFNFSIENI